MKVNVTTNTGNYDIEIGQNLLKDAGELLNLNRKVLIVTDTGIPKEYAYMVEEASKEGTIMVLHMGEATKNLESLTEIEKLLLEKDFTRGDCVIAVGGGVMGDLSGFAASIYMRGIDFYNIPTTLLSQVDSSIGGKTAIDFCGVKNILGAFYPPKKVIIDTDTLKTLPKRQISNGLAEVIKMAATFDEKFFEELESKESFDDFSDIIYKSVMIKRRVVEEDEKEAGLRKVLNFGHTLGHGIEAAMDGELLHGECVGLGMLCMCDDDIRVRLESILKRLDLPVKADFDIDKAMDAVIHDKKGKGDKISAVYVSKLGSFEFKDMDFDELRKRLVTVKEG